MSEVSTVHLKGPWGPQAAKYHKGYVIIDQGWVIVCDREDGRGNNSKYPKDNVASVENGTGW